MADLASRNGPKPAVLIADDRCAVIVKLAARLKRLQMATDLRGQKSRHVTTQIVSMRGDVAETSGRSTLARIGPPCGLLLVGILKLGPQPTLDVVGTYRLNLTQFSTENHLARLANQRIPRVVVGQCKDRIGLVDNRRKLFGLC